MGKKGKGSPVLQMLFAAMKGAVAGGTATVPAAAVMQILCALVAGATAGAAWRKLHGTASLFSRAAVGIFTRGIMLLTGFLATGTAVIGATLIADTVAVILGALMSGIFAAGQKSSGFDRIRQNPHRRSGNMRRK